MKCCIFVTTELESSVKMSYGVLYGQESMAWCGEWFICLRGWMVWDQVKWFGHVTWGANGARGEDSRMNDKAWTASVTYRRKCMGGKTVMVANDRVLSEIEDEVEWCMKIWFCWQEVEDDWNMIRKIPLQGWMNDGFDVVAIPSKCVMIRGKVSYDALVMMRFVISELRVWGTRAKKKLKHIDSYTVERRTRMYLVLKKCCVNVVW